jgi:hypothetical protein
MNPQKPIQAEDDEISLIDILLFLQASFSNVVKSLVVCLFAGGIYYFSIPKMFEASATIEMAKVAGELIETPADLLEKMKLPLYFSPATLQACGTDSGLISQAKFVDKIKPTINKSAPMVTFVTQAPSSQEAKACLNAVIVDVSSNQDAIASPLLGRKKQKLNELSNILKIDEDIVNNLSRYRFNNNINDTQQMASVLVLALRKRNVDEIHDLQSQISSLQFELIEPNSRPTTLLRSVYSSGVPVNNKRPTFILGFCLVLGVFLGLLVTGVRRVVPVILRQMREAEGRVR